MFQPSKAIMQDFALKSLKLHKRLYITILAVVTVAGYFLGHHRGMSKLDLHQDYQNLSIELQQIKKERTLLQEKLNVSERKYRIQQEAQKALELHLKLLQSRNAELSHHMALYQTVTGTELIDNPIQVKAFNVVPLEKSNAYRYAIMLTNVSGKDPLSGVVTIDIHGLVNEQPRVLKVKYVNAETDSGLAFHFQYFQELTGEVTLPESFVPESVTLNIKEAKINYVLKENFPWSA